MKKIDDNPYELSWLEEDIENRLGFHAGRYTSVNKGLSLLFALVLLFVFGGAIFGLSFVKSFQPISDMFLRSGNVWTLGPAMLLFFISITSLFFKGRKLTLQKRALSISTVPQNPDFVLNEQTAETALTRLRKVVDNPRHFILLNRVQTALASLHNIGAISEVASILKNQADNDENQVSSSYTMVSGAVWAIPVLGFIGTVMGLSSAIGNFAGTLSAAKNIEAIKGNLQSVTGGLSTAFETTLVALICALIIQLYLNYMQQKESDFLDECNDYCHTHVISKLRLAESVLEDRSPLAPTAKNIPDIKEEKAPIKAEAGHSSDPSEQEVKTPNNRSKDL
ncbi:MAG: MotA/TolQ/ExbB proton channel family protein [Verrucomicrobiota bacterium]|nr:MotA/TolQ/ExbB proton channel family protein [Verrucomicrobiota bacterium]|tara:strand:+ start:683 stop:1693 length:1011 start_codon:yes stop_codon:yes gene_type:complete